MSDRLLLFLLAPLFRNALSDPVEPGKHARRFLESSTRSYEHDETYPADLSHTSNPLGPPPAAIEALRSLPPVGLADYADSPGLDLCRRLAEHHGIDVAAVAVDAGICTLLKVLLDIWGGKDRPLVLAAPIFPRFEMHQILLGGETRSVTSPDLRADFDGLRRAARGKAVVVVLCNPASPTGFIEPREAILALADDFPGLVVVDEANIEFGGEGVLRDAPGRENLMVLRTFSKAYGLAGMRIGYAVASPALISHFRMIQTAFATSFASRAAAMAALGDTDHIERTKALLREENAYLQGELSALGWKVHPSSTNTFVADVSATGQDAAGLLRRLNAKGAHAVDGAFFEGLGARYLRIAPRMHPVNERFVAIARECRG